jgi:hypothetical protein
MLPEQVLETGRVLERRAKPRVKLQFPLVLCGLRENGDQFEEEGFLDNMSASGLFFWTEKLLYLEDRIFLTIQLSTSHTKAGIRSNYLSTNGKVVRVERSASNYYGIAIAIEDYHFI